MTSQLESIRLERDELLDRARALVDGPGYDHDIYEELTGQIEALNERHRRVDRLTRYVQNNPRALEAGSEPDAAGQRTAVEPALLPSLLPSADVLAELHAAVTHRSSLRLDTAGADLDRAAVLTTDTGANELAVQLSTTPRRLRRIAYAAGLPVETVAGITSVQFPIFGAGDAAITAEGQAKQEYDAITPGSATPQMITIFTDTSRQNLLTMTNFEGKLRTVLSAKVARREDALIVATVLANPGIQQHGVTALDADALLQAAGLVATGDVAAEPNLALVNPADLPAVVGPDVGSGGSASPGFASFLPTVHGMTIYPTAAIGAGSCLVGAWSAASRFVVGLPPTFLVDAVSGLKNNLVTVLLEEAVAIAVDEPAGFVLIQEPAGS